MRLLVVCICLSLAACASGPEEVPADVLAIQDYVEVAELPEVDRIRTYNSAGFEALGNERYVLLKARRDTYLVEFVRDCWELYDNQRLTTNLSTGMIGPGTGVDVRREPGYIRPGMDTLRGCRIGRAFELNEAQVEEIRNIGEAPTGG